MTSQYRKRNRSENQETVVNKCVNVQKSLMAGVGEISHSEQTGTTITKLKNENNTTLSEIMESLKMLHTKFDEQKKLVTTQYDDQHVPTQRIPSSLYQENTKLRNDISILKDVVIKQS